MKRWMAQVLAGLLALGLGGCGAMTPADTAPTTLPAVTEPGGAYLEGLRAELSREGHSCAVAFLGLFGGEYEGLAQFLEDQGFLEAYPCLAELPRERFVETEGEELYLVIPAGAADTVLVNEWVIDESNGFAGGKGRVLYAREAGDPILLRGNISDIMPNLLLRIGELAYTPYMSLRDGLLAVPEGPGVMDITRYPE